MENTRGLGGPRVVILAVVVTIVIIVGALIVSGYSFTIRSQPPGIPYSSYGISIDKPSPAYYATGEIVRIEFSIADYKVGNLTISSPNQCVFGFRIRITDTQGPVVYDSAKHMDCSGPPFKTTLVPRENFTAGPEKWNQLDDNGTQVPFGRYEVMGYYTGSNNSLITRGEMVAGAIYFGKPAPISLQAFLQNYYISLSTDAATYSPGKPVRIDEGVFNSEPEFINGPNIDSLMTSPCSFSYQILNLTNALVFDSLRHQSCSGSLVDNLVVPQGSLFRRAYWNQTYDSGAIVPLGLYHIVEHAKLVSGGRDLNATKRLNILVGSDQPSGEEILILSSFIGYGPTLSSNLRVQGELRSIQLFLNGVNISTRNYTAQCCQTRTDLPFETSIDNSTVPVFRGGAYDIVFVATFRDGKTSLTWAIPGLPWGGVP